MSLAERPRYQRIFDEIERVPTGARSGSQRDNSYSVHNGSHGRFGSPGPEYGDFDEENTDDASSIDENYDVHSITSSNEDNLTCRGRMQVVLHSNAFQLIIISLIILDIIIVLFELLLDVGALGNIVCPGGNFLEQTEFCHFHEASRAMCAPSPRLELKGQFLRSNQMQVECKCGFRGGRTICVPKTEVMGVNPALTLHGLSLLILTIFVFEVGLKLIAFRLKYFTHKFEVFDGAIVLISWMLDLASLLEEEAFQAASLLILLRLWRIIRVINGSVLSSLTRSNSQLHKARREAKSIIHAFHKAQDRLDEVQGENSTLKEEIKQLRQRYVKS